MKKLILIILLIGGLIMIGIKKVEVVPLDQNYATVIDSFETTDDKTTNAPSINAVENYVGEQINGVDDKIDALADGTGEEIVNIYNAMISKGDIAVITGSFQADISHTDTSGRGVMDTASTINYPEGFDMNNSIIISTQVRDKTNSNLGYYATTGDDTTTIGAGFAVQLRGNYIVAIAYVRGYNSDTSVKIPISYKIVLMKVD